MSKSEAQTVDERQPSHILRTWRGFTRAADAERYVRYMSETGYSALRATPGNLGVLGLLRISGDRAEHRVISLWESDEAIRQFAGDDIARAVFYPDDDAFLTEKDEHVDHFEVVFADGWEPR